ncbi:acetate CoA-transferase [Ventosimonas gracilis]|uniref:3-oxoadipate CoA-transferase n=1 Tax=Ventosimonas gracilis TaxID=1680762 RepID=A0A139SXB8_9GAMM|nr:CoA transferase subunit A [Ventosimonas gracilis]KXU39236.1 acetate CoA-transferase [Ventosimonas gracilis]
MHDKTCPMEQAIAQIEDGMTVMVGGFGIPGTPFLLIEALRSRGCKNLTLIKNDANEKGMGIDHLLAAGQVRKLIATHIGLNANAIALMNAGRLEVEFCAQGILAERIRAGGAGIAGIVTDIGIGTRLAEGKQRLGINGQSFLFEAALRADVALIHAESADCFGNLRFAASARNFNPLMAMAADKVIVEAEQRLPLGAIGADDVHCPGVFVDAVVPIELTGAYDVKRT